MRAPLDDLGLRKDMIGGALGAPSMVCSQPAPLTGPGGAQ